MPALSEMPIQNEAEVQRFLAKWTGQLVKRNAELTEKVDTTEAQADRLRDLIVSKDNEIEKLQNKVKDLKRKVQSSDARGLDCLWTDF
jgi:predicted RNase H-like nuclease (RuvC/YqgF family)